MVVLLAANLRERIMERSRRGETFTFLHQGKTYHWNVSAGWKVILEKPRETVWFRPGDQGVDIHHVLDRYRDMDIDYALTCDLSVPLLFVPFAGAAQLVDGWHRLAKALIEEETLGSAELPAYLLTQQEADSLLLPPNGREGSRCDSR
jgi:hypothetical protein